MRYILLYLTFFLNTIFLSQKLFSQQLYRTLNPKIYSRVSPENMIHLNLDKILSKDSSLLNSGIIGKASENAEIRIKVYQYDEAAESGIGALLYEEFINHNTLDFAGLGVIYKRNELGSGASEYPNIWDSKNIKASSEAIYRKKYGHLNIPRSYPSIPVIIEISQGIGAKLDSFNIPGIGRLFYDDLIAYQNMLKNLLSRNGTRFAMIGDYGWEGPNAKAVSDLVKSWDPNFIVTQGDDNYEDKLNNSIDDNVGQYYHKFIYPYNGNYGQVSYNQTNRFFPVLGNHDYKNIKGSPSNYLLNQWLNYFTLPTNGKDERYYDFVRGDVHFFALNWNPQEPDGRDENSMQALWLKNKLASSTSKFNIVVGHQTPYSSGFVNRPGHGSLEVLQWPFKEWGADLVISGHEHIYERLLIDGLTYVVNGVGGAPLYNFVVLNPKYISHIEGEHGAILGEVVGNKLKFKFITTSLRIQDTFEIHYTPHESRLIKGANFEVKPLVSGTVFGQNDDNSILSLFTSEHLSNANLKFTAPLKNNMFLRLDNVQGQDLMFAAANQTILDKSIDPEEHNRPNITHLGSLFKASIEGQQLDYHLYKVSTTRNQLFLEAGVDGPFFINSDIGVKGIQPNSINDKVLNRSKYPNMALVAAHRGFWQEPGIPENTTLAFERSIALGADLMELDILKTHDGVYVLFHDNEVYRITNFTTRGIGVEHFNWDTPRANVQYKDENGIVKTVDLPPLKTLKLKDRFDNITPQRIQTLEEGLTYLKPKNVFVTLDKMDKFIDDIYVMVLKLGIEDNVLFKGAIVKDNQPDALEEKYGNIMQQINFTPVFFETTPDFVEVVEEFLRREREEGWTISALEPQMKTDADHLIPDPGGITKQQHNAMKNLINNYKGTKWIGMASITPWHCGDGFLRDHCAPKTGFKIGCANYDWRADPDFCIDYAQINYFITDRPKVIIDYLKVRGMH